MYEVKTGLNLHNGIRCGVETQCTRVELEIGKEIGNQNNLRHFLSQRPFSELDPNCR